DQAVDTIFAAVKGAQPGETYIPRVPSARVIDIATALIGKRKIEITMTGIRPGEKLHEILVSEEERFRTVDRGDFYAIDPILPELRSEKHSESPLQDEYSSAQDLMTPEQVVTLLRKQKLMLEDVIENGQELLR
ncbi:MAG: polysaccharide biosynthesis protein, partial [Planctomycetes bacterium]|nr:polysaccharide biosynthesis protein [Planctomycetota bacterium]